MMHKLYVIAQMYPVCQLCDSSPTLSVSDFVESRKLITMDSKSAMLHGKVQSVLTVRIQEIFTLEMKVQVFF